MHKELPLILRTGLERKILGVFGIRKWFFELGRIENWGMKNTKRSSSSCGALRGEGADFKSRLSTLVKGAHLHSTHKYGSGWERCWKAVWLPELGRKRRKEMKREKENKRTEMKANLVWTSAPLCFVFS